MHLRYMANKGGKSCPQRLMRWQQGEAREYSLLHSHCASPRLLANAVAGQQADNYHAQEPCGNAKYACRYRLNPKPHAPLQRQAQFAAHRRQIDHHVIDRDTQAGQHAHDGACVCRPAPEDSQHHCRHKGRAREGKRSRYQEQYSGRALGCHVGSQQGHHQQRKFGPHDAPHGLRLADIAFKINIVR